MVTLATINTFSTPEPLITELPRIVGTQRAGTALTVDPGSMSTPTAYQWRVNGANISGANGAGQVAPDMPMGAQISCLVTSVEGTAETPAIKIYHPHADPTHNEMDDAVLALIPHQPATHIAKQDGDWSSTATWDAGTVPGAGAIVLVPFGRTVTYDIASSPRLDRLRIDGLLNFAIDQSTDLLVETIVATQSGELRIGTPGGRLPLNHTATLRFSDRAYTVNPDSPTDLDIANDPTLMSRGLLWHGKVSIWAAKVTPWLRTAVAPMAGAQSLTLSKVPTGWAAGDTIIIGGTHGNETNNVFTHETEERVITSINGTTVNWSGGLQYNHDHQNDLITGVTDLQPAIANEKRNVVMKTEAPHEDAVWRRAHTMAIHGTAIADLWSVAFLDMGRTDKSQPASGVIRDGQFASYTPDSSPEDQYLGQLVDAALQTTLEGIGYIVTRNVSEIVTKVGYESGNPLGLSDIKVDASGVITAVKQNVIRKSPLTAQSNLQTRYPVHVHFLGFGRGAEKSAIHDCYVRDAPAWAYVHHGCEADFFDNVAYRFVGAGMVGETADEIGAWVGNLMVGTRRGFNGDRATKGNIKVVEGDEGRKGDFGFAGMGMFFRGRAVRANSNFVMSAPSAYVFFHRAEEGYNSQLSFKRKVIRDTVDVKNLSYLKWNDGYIDSNDIPIRHFAGNECAGVPGYGFNVTKSGSKQDHALAINVKNNKFWAVGIGTHLEYVARYNFLNNRFYGTGRSVGGKTKVGFRLAAIQISNVRNHIEGFETGMDLWGVGNFSWNKDFSLPENPLFAIIEPTLINNEVDYTYVQDRPEKEGLTTVSAEDVTLFTSTTPSTIVPTFTGPNFPAYSWDGSTSIKSLTLPNVTYGVRDYDIEAGTVNPGDFYLVPSLYAVTPWAIEDSLGTSPLPVSYDTSGLYTGQSDHNTKEPSSGPNAGVLLESDAQTTNTSGYDLQALALRDGYWTYDTGAGVINVLVFPMYISDRLTGRLGIVTIAVECTGDMSNYTNNGEFILSASAPVRADIVTSTPANTAITIDVLTAAVGEPGATLTLSRDLIKPDYGEITKVGGFFNNGDGTLTYTPDLDYVSRPNEPGGDPVPDVFYVLVEDGRGRYTSVQIDVTVTP